MVYNKYIGWDSLLGLVDNVQKYSPWLSRQIAKTAGEWPYWYSGLQIEQWEDRRVHVRLPMGLRNSVEGELSHGHILLGAELVVRLLCLKARQEFPFYAQIMQSRMEILANVNQSIDYRLELPMAEWERWRLGLARESQIQEEITFNAYLGDGRLAVNFSFQLRMRGERLLPA